MRLTITVEQLKSVGACREAIAAFRQLYGESGTEYWTRDRQIELLKGPLGKFVAWAWRNNLLPLWYLAGADLAGANLAGADLAGANLARANLAGADLDDCYWPEDAPEGWKKLDNGRLKRKDESQCTHK